MSKFIVLRGADEAVLATDLQFSATYQKYREFSVIVPQNPNEAFTRIGQTFYAMSLMARKGPKGEPVLVTRRSIAFGEAKHTNIEENLKKILPLPEDDDDEEATAAVKKMRMGASNRIDGFHRQLRAKTAIEQATLNPPVVQQAQVESASGVPAPPTTFAVSANVPVWTIDEENKMQGRIKWLVDAFTGRTDDEDVDINAAETPDGVRDQLRDLFAEEIALINADV